MSVFVSWTGSDREIKNKLVEGLKAELGPEELVWESDEHCVSDFSKECIQAIHQSQVFIIIISDQAMEETSFVYHELLEAHACEMHGKLNMIVYKVTDSEYTDRFRLHLNHISDANHVGRLMKTEAGIQSVAKRAKYLLARRKSGNPEKPYDVYKPEIEGTKLSNTGYFVPNSREDVFEEFDKGFEKSNVLFAAQISGYGRRSAARKYAEIHMEEYDECLILHFFSGSLREFFLNGLVISNINENVFEGLDENKIILKKVNLLKKLDTKTLIIVPNVTIGKRDDTFILDVLSNLGCRVIFITQSVPVKMRGIFPVVEVGRLKNHHLRELFFNYYEEADADEQEALEIPLNHFFESIDGHTKSVEITASALAEEIGVYPEDIPEILDNIQLNSENELSERIFQLISNMFEVKDFEEAEKNILFLASVAAEIPLDEKQFVALSRACGVDNNAAIKNLAECRWLDRDRATKTIFIESLLANVCIAKIPTNDQILEQCIRYFTEILIDECAGYSIGASVVTVKRLHHIFKVLNFHALQELMNLYIISVDDVLEEVGNTNCQRIIDAAKRECEQIESPKLREAVESIFEYAAKTVGIQLKIFDLSRRAGRSSLGEAALQMTAMSTEMMDSIEEMLEEMGDTSVTRVVRRLLDSSASFNSGKFVTEFLKVVDELECCLSIDPTEEEIGLLALLEVVGQQMALMTRSESYLSLEICRAREKLLNYSGGFCSVAEAYFFYETYLQCLLDMAECTEELERVFEFCISALEQAKKEIWKTEREALIIKNRMICVYAQCLADNGRPEDAEDAYYLTRELKDIESETFKLRIMAVDCIAKAFIRIGELQDAKEFLEDYLEDFKKVLGENKTKFTEERVVFEELTGILQVLNDPKSDSDFKDGSEEYVDYYRTYASGFFDKRLLSKYAAIAEQAKKLDFSDKSREQLLAAVVQLKQRAMQEAKWDKLAPTAFALVSEAGNRVLGYHHHYVQYMGGAAIADGKIAEILNGEGKTYTIILAAFLKSLYGKQVYIVDSSAYLTKRNFVWMKGVLEYLGCRVGLLADSKSIMAGPELERLQSCDIIYAMMNELVFLQMNHELGKCSVQMRLDTAIIDEADQLMIEEAAQVINISEKTTQTYTVQAYELADLTVRSISAADIDCFENKNGIIILKPGIYDRLQKFLKIPYAQLPEMMRNDLEKALKVAIIVYLYYKNGKDYYLIDGKVKIENKDKGLLMEANPIYQFFIGRKEHISSLYKRIDFNSHTALNQYIFMEFLWNFGEICGTTATASSMKEEFKELYNLDVISIPPNQPIARVDHKPKVYFKEQYKLLEISRLTQEKNQTGQPVIIITGSIDESEKISRLFADIGVEHRLLNAKNSEDEPELLGNAGKLNSVIVTTAMANRGIDILLGGNPREIAKHHLMENGVSAEMLNRAVYGALEEDEEIEEIRTKYEVLTALYKNKTDAEKKKVEQLGGLCVIGTECFEDLRIEQQMRGRAGRQGAVGESYVFYSLDDRPMVKLLGDRKEVFMSLFQSVESETMESNLLNKGIVNGRLRLQEMHFKYLQKTPEMLYYRNARKEILGMIQKLRMEKISVEELVEKYIIKNEEFLERIQAVSQIQNKEFASKVLKFTSYMEKEFLDKAGRWDAAMLRKGYQKICADFNERVNQQDGSEHFMKKYLTACLRMAWKEYLKKMPIEKRTAENLFRNKDKKAEKYMAEYSDSQCGILIKDAVFYAFINFMGAALTDNQ